MSTGPISRFQGNITRSHIHALDQGAMISTPLLVNSDQQIKTILKPGEEIEVNADEAGFVRCRIVDVEQIHGEGDQRYVRVTLEKA